MSRIIIITVLSLLFTFDINAQDEPWLVNIKNIEASLYSTFGQLKEKRGIHLDLVADQITTRINGGFQPGYIRFAQESRYNTQFEGRLNFSSIRREQFFILHFIQQIEDEKAIIEGFSQPQMNSLLATLYLMKGLGLGYLGLLHDSSVILDRNTDYKIENSWGFFDQVKVFNLKLSPYEDVIEAGIKDIEKSLEIVDEMTTNEQTFELLFLNSPIEVAADNFKKLANSLIAKLLINSPRDKSGLVDYSRVLTYAEEGLDDEYPNILFTASENVPLWDEYFMKSNYLPSCDLNSESDCSSEIKTDVKILHLLDSTYAKAYPSNSIEYSPEEKLVYRKAVSEDPRLAYFNYSTKPSNSIGNIFSNSYLHSNYYSLRNYYGQEWDKEKFPFIVMTRAELQYIIAECYFNLGNIEKANSVLQNSPYGTKATELEIDLPSVQLGVFPVNGFAFNGPKISPDPENFKNLLHKEYSVEISTLTTVGTLLFFMRRHNLLQMYSPTQYPPEDTYIFGKEDYVYGGINNFDIFGTSKGLGAWKKNTDLTVPNFNDYFSRIGRNSIYLRWSGAQNWENYPEDTPPVINIKSNTIGLDTLITPYQNNLTIEGLRTGVPITFSLEVASEYRENSYKDSVTFIPNSYGLKRTSEDYFYAQIYQERTNVIKLFNLSDTELVIDSVKLHINDIDNLYTKIYDLFDFKSSNITIDPNTGYNFEIKFESDLWVLENLGPLVFTFYSKEENQSYVYENFSIAPSQMRAFWNLIPSGDRPYWNIFYSATDSISFGEVPIGRLDSLQVQIRNMSLKNISIDSLYLSDKSWIEIGASENSSSYESNSFYFEQPAEKLTLKPYQWGYFWLFVKPEEDTPNDLFGFIKGDLSTEYNSIGHFYVNQGERTTVETEVLNDFPSEVGLRQNYPNPFNPNTNINYSIPITSKITLEVFNIVGQKVATLINGETKSPGRYSIQFNASKLPSGMYFYRLNSNGKVLTQKMTLIK